ncbi:hypothetical protein J4209_00960 [Candidatus Woesearchaeota archaeon]|nr:hypothetical protein [Candidatus Woesearchaeota archaeon]
MDKELIEKIKKESINLLILLVIAIVIFKIVFFKEIFLVIIRTVLAFFWMFIIPGFALMYYWHEKLSFLERFAIGAALSGAVIGLSSYYFGLLGLNIKYHGILLPSLSLIVGVIIIWKKGIKNPD